MRFDIPYDFAGVALPAFKQARLFGVGSPFVSPALHKFLIDLKNAHIASWFEWSELKEGIRRRKLSVHGAWVDDEYINNIHIEWHPDGIVERYNSVCLVRSEHASEVPACDAPIDVVGLMERIFDDTGDCLLADRQELRKKLFNARSEATTAYVYVAYAMCCDLLELTTKLEKIGVSTEVFVKQIDAFLAERGIEPVAG